MSVIKCLRDYVDDVGESHIDEVEIELEPLSSEKALPAISAFFPAAQYRLLLCAAGSPDWPFGNWHLAGRLLLVTLRGEWEMQTTDGSVRRFGPGDMLLTDETRGRGHRSRMVGAEESALVAVHLSD